MATKKSGEEPEAQEAEPDPEPVVDPPEATSEDTQDAERPTGSEWVRIDQTATVTLPSGASYVLGAGDVLELQPEDAAFVIDQGYGAKVDEPSGE
jgi:hypothetical protein